MLRDDDTSSDISQITNPFCVQAVTVEQRQTLEDRHKTNPHPAFWGPNYSLQRDRHDDAKHSSNNISLCSSPHEGLGLIRRDGKIVGSLRLRKIRELRARHGLVRILF